MGFLEYGTPLEWGTSLEVAKYIREHGVAQFLAIFHRVRARSRDELKWGDEIEYHLVEFRPETRETRLRLISREVLDELAAADAHTHTHTSAHSPDKREPNLFASWHPEYGSWMVEATPRRPFGAHTDELAAVAVNMALRRAGITRACERVNAATLGGRGVTVLPFSMVTYPLMGVGTFTSPARPAGGPFSRSAYVPDAMISAHPRFGTLTANIRHRRGEKVCIMRPLFRDEHTLVDAVTAVEVPAYTPHPLDGVETVATHAATDAATHFCCDADDTDVGPAHIHRPGFIHMDAMGFGMGCCCLQVTFQARDLAESRYLYDQLAVLSPLMLALTANTPAWRGHLCDEDTRWDTIVESVDCRTPAERGEVSGHHTPVWLGSSLAANAAGRGQRRIGKSRYSSIDCFISASPLMKDEYNDVALEVDDEAMAALQAGGVDDRLARHIAHLFIRDPLVIFKERVHVNDALSSEHFENIQSTNWRSVRWKPPPPDAHDMGWRVELRTMEVQLTDFENAAFTVFVVLVSRVILFFDLNLYIPMSRVDANFDRAKQRRAASMQRFFFRRHVTPQRSDAPAPAELDAVDELSLRDVMLGHGDFPGLIPLIYAYLEVIKCDIDTRNLVDVYLQFVSARACGDVMTGATWQRAFIAEHPEYKKDSVLSPGIVYDLLSAVAEIASGGRPAPELLGAHADVRGLNQLVNHILTARESGELGVAAASMAAGFTSSSVSGASATGAALQGDIISSPASAPVTGVRMRGRSYAEEIKESSFHTPAIRALLDRYSIKPHQNFYEVPAFLE